jgi:hypothetical protein
MLKMKKYFNMKNAEQLKMRPVGINLLLLISFTLSLNCHASDPATPEEEVREKWEHLNVNVDRVIGPVTYAGSGWLTGAFSAEVPGDELLNPLKTRRVRSNENYLVSVYERCMALGISMELVTNRKSHWAEMKLDGTDDMTSFVNRHTDLVKRMVDRGMSGISYSIFQESNARGLGWVESNEPYYLEAYRLAYHAIKQADPTALVVGPNAQWGPWTWWWPEHEGDYTWFIRKFIDFCIENQCLPDIIAWHDGYHCDGSGIANAAEEIRNYLKQNGIAPIPLEQDDVGCKDRQFSPGTYVSYLANIERAEIKYTAKCCWDRDCHIFTLQGLLTKESRQPRSLWWMYKSYGDLMGQIVDVEPGNTVDAVVSIDKEADIIRAVIGRYRESSEPVIIRFRGLENRFKSASVRAERIRNTEDKPLEAPERTIVEKFEIRRNRQLEIILDDLESFDAYSLTIVLID